MDIRELYLRATGFEPYDFQVRVAEEGLPDRCIRTVMLTELRAKAIGGAL